MGFKLTTGYYRGQCFKNQRGEGARDKTENASNIKQHYRSVFNRNTPVDQSVLDKLEQCPINDSISDMPNIKEVKDAVQKMNNKKAPGHSKVILEEGIQFLTSVIVEYGTDINCQNQNMEHPENNKPVQRKRGSAKHQQLERHMPNRNNCKNS